MKRNNSFHFTPSKKPEPAPEPPSRVESLIKRIDRFFVRYHDLFMLGAGLTIALVMILVYHVTRPVPQRLTQRDINNAVVRAMASATPPPFFAAEAYETIRPSLVRIEALTIEADGKSEEHLGTGVVVDDRGTILTSLHVVKDSESINILFSDGSESPAILIVAQPENDLAVLQAMIIPDDLVPAVLAGSGGLRVGDQVVAVGNPFGINNSLSSGVISGLGRNITSPETGETMTNLIQFDAAVNPGNSGGPLLNRDGEVVGIVASLLNPTNQDFFIGIGFAVPIETAVAAAGGPPL